MSFGLLHKHRERVGRPDSKKNPLSELNTADPIFLVRETMEGNREAIYHVNMIDLMDRVFTRDDMRSLSIDQERFVSKFFVEAGIVTDAFYSGDENPKENMDYIMAQFDSFLGSYFGVNYDRLTRQR